MKRKAVVRYVEEIEGDFIPLLASVGTLGPNSTLEDVNIFKPIKSNSKRNRRVLVSKLGNVEAFGDTNSSNDIETSNPSRYLIGKYCPDKNTLVLAPATFLPVHRRAPAVESTEATIINRTNVCVQLDNQCDTF
jgi:hypothetical protein